MQIDAASTHSGALSSPCCGMGTCAQRFCDPACRQVAYRRRRANAPENTPAQRQGGRGRKLNPSPGPGGAKSDRADSAPSPRGQIRLTRPRAAAGTPTPRSARGPRARRHERDRTSRHAPRVGRSTQTRTTPERTSPNRRPAARPRAAHAHWRRNGSGHHRQRPRSGQDGGRLSARSDAPGATAGGASVGHADERTIHRRHGWAFGHAFEAANSYFCPDPGAKIWR